MTLKIPREILDKARNVPIADVAGRISDLKRNGTQSSGPCPGCVGDDLAENSPHPQVADSAVRPVDPIIILVTPAARGRFRASFDSRVLVEVSATPFLDAARVLAGEGIDGATKIVMRHEGQSHDALISTVGAAAKLTVKESTKDGRPRFVGWHPFRELGVRGSPPISETDPASTPTAPASPRASHGGDI